ncbi:MAG: hypothetical protein C0403_09245 [Desulfobacterium sp.]|nr:hypothetical protein [Desulfobacterium sp.]
MENYHKTQTNENLLLKIDESDCTCQLSSDFDFDTNQFNDTFQPKGLYKIIVIPALLVLLALTGVIIYIIY